MARPYGNVVDDGVVLAVLLTPQIDAIARRLTAAHVADVGSDTPRDLRPGGGWRSRAASIARFLVGFAFVTGTIVGYVHFMPPMPEGLGFPIDNDAWFVLNAAWSRGFTFGRDVVWTFGPYSFDYLGQYHPSTDPIALATSMLLAIAFAAGMLHLAPNFRIVLLLPITVFLVMPPPDPLFLILPAVFLILVCRTLYPVTHAAHLAASPAVHVAIALLAVALGLLPLIKGTFLGSAGSAAALAVLALAWQRQFRSAALIVVCAVASTLFFWVIAGQELTALPGYFQVLVPIVKSYDEAYSKDGSGTQAIVYGCLALAFLALLYVGMVRRTGFVGHILFIGVAFELFIGFKDGFIRHDHELIALNTLVLLALIFFAQRPTMPAVVAVGVAMTAYGLIGAQYATFAQLGDWVTSSWQKSAEGLTMRLSQPGELQRRYDQSLASIRQRVALPDASGRVDVYPYGELALVAFGMDWWPRPVYQSAMAFTPELEEMNLQHISGPDAPDAVLFRLDPLDGHLPALEDGLSWPVLLSRYSVSAYEGKSDMLLLTRNASPDASPADVWRGEVVLDQSVGVGEQLSLPHTNGPLWAEIDIEPTILGRLAEAAYKLPILQISVKFVDGHSESYRYVPGMGKAGFVLSPVVRHTRDFAALTAEGSGTYLADRVATSMSIDGNSGTRWLWQPSFTVRLRRLNLPAKPAASDLLFDPIGNGGRDLRQGSGLAAQCSLDAVNNRSPSNGPIAVGDKLNLRGWAMVPTDEQGSTDEIDLQLTGGAGDIHVVRAALSLRPDVNLFLHLADTQRVGFSVDADVSNLSGEYRLSIHPGMQGRFWTCARQQDLVISNPI